MCPTDSEPKTEHVYPLVIKEKHLDTFGHVNNATYFEIFEEARWELVSERGYGLAQVQKQKKGPIILEATIKFTAELKLREKVEIRTSLVDYPKKIGRLYQSIHKSDGTLAAEVTFVFGLFDLKERKMIPPTEEWKYAIGLTSKKPDNSETV